MHKNLMSRLENGLEVIRWIFNTALKKNIKTIIFAGDLFQDRKCIHTISYEKTFSLIKEFMDKSDLNLFLLLGNHDMWHHNQWDVSSISPLRAIKNVQVIDYCGKVEVLSDYYMDFLPYTKNPLEDIKKFKKKSDVLITHIAVDDAKLNNFTNAEISVEYDGDMTKVCIDRFTGWKKIFSGHYHLPQKLNENFEYIGSPYELNFGEAFQQKHLIIFDTESLENEYVVNEFSPKHLIIKENQVDKYKLDGNFVQVLVEDITSTNIVDMRQKLTKGKIVNLEFREQKKKETTEEVKKVDMSKGDTLERFAQQIGFGNLNFEKLIKIGKEICYDD
jgi:DNA repair exonuclease SbcCD nuclease subunit